MVVAAGLEDEPARSRIEEGLGTPEMCWLDIESPNDDEVRRLGAQLALHVLAIDDSTEFGQPAKFDLYGDHMLVVAYGVGDDDSLVEVHCYYSTRYLVTLHHAPVSALDELIASSSFRAELAGEPVPVLHAIVDALYGSYQAVVDRIDDRLTDIEDAELDAPDDANIEAVVAIKRQIADLKRTVAQARDALGTAHTPLVDDLPGMTESARPYVLDLSTTVRQLASDIGELERHASSIVEMHLTLMSNRQNDVMEQLTLVATIFLPLSFLVGFFGQNFSTLISIQAGWASFIVFGIVLDAVSVVALLLLLRRRGWS